MNTTVCPRYKITTRPSEYRPQCRPGYISYPLTPYSTRQPLTPQDNVLNVVHTIHLTPDPSHLKTTTHPSGYCVQCRPDYTSSPRPLPYKIRILCSMSYRLYILSPVPLPLQDNHSPLRIPCHPSYTSYPLTHPLQDKDTVFNVVQTIHLTPCPLPLQDNHAEYRVQCRPGFHQTLWLYDHSYNYSSATREFSRTFE